MNNLYSILEHGIKPGVSHIVYLCETPQDSAKFAAIHGVKEILVCKVKMLKKDEKLIEETFDHSERFFKCRSYGYRGLINPEKITDLIKYSL